MNTDLTSESIIKVIIVDDEKAARDGINILLKKDSSIEVVSICKLGSEAIQVINNSKPDIIFLDIQMPEINGFQVLQEIDPEHMPVVVFVTAYDVYALKAFEVNALDYLLKPFSDEKFYNTLERAKEYFRKTKSYELQKRILSIFNPHMLDSIEDLLSLSIDTVKYKIKIPIKQKNETIFVKVSDIEWIEANDYYVMIYTHEKKYLIRETIKNFEKSLDPAKFVRVNRSNILNVDKIKKIETLSSTEKVVVTHDGKRFRVSKSGNKNIKSNING
jgi:two-component system LytT family response regulator